MGDQGLAGEGVGQMLKSNPLLLHMHKVWDPSGHLTVEGPWQMT